MGIEPNWKTCHKTTTTAEIPVVMMIAFAWCTSMTSILAIPTALFCDQRIANGSVITKFSTLTSTTIEALSLNDTHGVCLYLLAWRPLEVDNTVRVLERHRRQDVVEAETLGFEPVASEPLTRAHVGLTAVWEPGRRSTGVRDRAVTLRAYIYNVVTQSRYSLGLYL